MSKFNTTDKRDTRTSAAPITTKPVPTGTTYNGAAGYEYETLSQLFLLACANMVGEDTFYENGKVRDARYVQLIYKAVEEGHSEWLGRFFPWLRNSANMRSAAIIGAVEATRAMVDRKIPGGRALINSTFVRADEPGEALAYFMSTYGRHVPKPIKRGVADAATRLYNERNALKYDTASKGLRFGDVVELVHPAPRDLDQGTLFKFLLDRGHQRNPLTIPSSLTMIHANQKLREQATKDPQVLLNTARLRQAGMTWEDVLSLAGNKVNKADLWRAMIPEMGYMALLRNLRNFDETGVNGDAVDWVKAKLTSPAEVAKSRQLPLRFLSAYRAVPSSRWLQPLETALDRCLNSLPTFAGRTLILIDTSGSMVGTKVSAKSTLDYADTATVFGLALAARCDEANVVSFSGVSKVFPPIKGESLLRGVMRFKNNGYVMGGGTATASAVATHYRAHDRLVVLTDEQANDHRGINGAYSVVSPNVPVITFNLAGYKHGHGPVNGVNRITIGGLSDAAFTLLPALEGRARQEWPF